MFAAAEVVSKLRNVNLYLTTFSYIRSPQKQPAPVHSSGSRLQSVYYMSTSSCYSYRSCCPSYFLCGARPQPQRRATRPYRNSTAGSYRMTSLLPSLDRCGIHSVVVLHVARFLFKHVYQMNVKNLLNAQCWCVVNADAMQPLTYS